MQIKKVTDRFVEYDNFGMEAKSFGRFDKGEEAIFEIYQNRITKPIRVRFFISFLDRVANPYISLNKSQLFEEANRLLKKNG